MKLLALLLEQPNLHQFNLYCLTQGGKVSHREEKKHKLVLFYKMINSLAPEYLSSLASQTVGNISQYNLRNKTNLQTIPARSQQYYNSFLPSTTRIWNSLPDDTKHSPSVESFKHKLNNSITKPPPYNFSGSRLGQIYHVRIRLNYSLRYLFSRKTSLIILCENVVILKILHTFSYTAISTGN